MPRCRPRSFAAAATLALLGVAVTSHAADDDRSADRVDAAIAKGVAYLLARPAFVKNGNWEESPARLGDDNELAQWGGRTALCTYALLASGVSPNDPRLRPAIDFLRAADIVGTYALGLRAQVWLYLPMTADNHVAVARDAKLLLKALKRDASRADSGLFDYVVTPRERIDLSVSQYGVLGLWACAQLDAEIPGGGAGNVWRLMDARWKSLQDKATGSWSYGGGGVGTASITAAGVATLFITQDYLTSNETLAAPAGNQRSPAIEKGLDFLAAELPHLLAADETTWRHYALYGIERVGVASGRKYFGNVDWYRAGSDFLTRTQDLRGEWHGDAGDEVTTSFSMLFLARGREPVMMNKLKFNAIDRDDVTVEAAWNERARDVANVARFVARRSERGLNWQTIDLDVGSVRDLHDAPIAYVAAPNVRSLRLPPASVAMLRQYVDDGGLLLVNADQPPRTATTKSDPMIAPKVAMLDAIFKGTGYTLRALPPDHPIFSREQFKAANWSPRPTVWGITNGVRELAVVLDDDAARAWQANQYARSRESFELMANLYQYAIDRDHAQSKGRTYVVPLDPSAVTTSSVRLARLQYDGNWNPEPGGWRRMQAIERRDHRLDLQLQTVDLDRRSLDGFAIAHLTGTAATTFSEQAIATLKAFVARGGLLVVDAAGGSAAFAASVEQQLPSIVPAARAGGSLIDVSDPLYATADGNPYRARYRAFAIASIGSLSAPRLRGTRNASQRWGILYSPDDLSAGLVGNEVDGIRGYTPEVATDLMDRIVRYAAEQAR